MSSADSSATSIHLYDTVPYVSEPYAESHPDLIAAIVRGFSLAAPAVDTARILELGCSAGNNLIPLAAFIPKTACLGVDASERAIEIGKAEIARAAAANCRLNNIELQRRRFEDCGDLGSFDYVISHGVYSWITPEQRRILLGLIQRSLAPDGIAYISFNTFPGWYQRMPVRDLMRYHLTNVEKTPDPRHEIAEARLIAAAFAELTDRRDGIYRQTLNHAASQFTHLPDWYLFHDYLEPQNHPVYFSRFIDEIADAGLRFIADVEQNEVSAPEFRSEIERVEAASGPAAPRSREQREQYYDFTVNRAFRRAIVARADRPYVRPETVLPLERRLRSAQAVSQRPAVHPYVRFQAASGGEITNFLHESIEISPFAAEVIKRLDGSSTIEQIAAQLGAASILADQSAEKVYSETVETIDLLLSLAVLSG